MSGQSFISSSKLAALIGTPNCPSLIDVRIDEDFALDPRLAPTAKRYSHETLNEWATAFAGADVAVFCQQGLKLSQGTAAWLRHYGSNAKAVEGGFEAWANEGHPLIDLAQIGTNSVRNPTVWVMRENTSLDLVAVAWFLRRFVDREAVFLFAADCQVANVAERFSATPIGCDWAYTVKSAMSHLGLTHQSLEYLAQTIGRTENQLTSVSEVDGLALAWRGVCEQTDDDLLRLKTATELFDQVYRGCVVSVETLLTLQPQ